MSLLLYQLSYPGILRRELRQKTLLRYSTVRRRCLPYADTLTLCTFYIRRKFLVVHPQGLEPCSQAWKACDSTSLSSGAYKAIFFLFAWLSVKFFIAKIPAHSDTVLSSERASYLRQRKTNKRTNFLLYISQTFRTITSLAAVALRHTLIGIRVLVPTWYSIRESNSVLYLERVATQPICLMEYN